VKTVPFQPLDPALYREIVRRALAEDICWGDVTTEATIPPDLRARGVILAKSACVIAGLDVAAEAFHQLDPGCAIEAQCRDGERCGAGKVVAKLHGRAAAMLTAERTALNFLQRLTGIATLTRRFVDAADGRITILDTRKTTPLLRALEKYAVRAGGGTNHRFGLFDRVLIKDNHVRLAGGVARAVGRARAQAPGLTIEVEAQTVDEAGQAADAGADIVLLDNLSTADIRRAVALVAGRARTEISGGVTLGRIAELATTGADFVSVGALTHSVVSSDISFEIAPFTTS
jgi:nicotinate-nucleotide pyrophosphorylase (carboxylating)